MQSVLLCKGRTLLQSDPLNSNSLSSSFSPNSSGKSENFETITIDTSVKSTFHYSPLLVRGKISTYFSVELSGSDCTQGRGLAVRTAIKCPRSKVVSRFLQGVCGGMCTAHAIHSYLQHIAIYQDYNKRMYDFLVNKIHL